MTLHNSETHNSVASSCEARPQTSDPFEAHDVSIYTGRRPTLPPCTTALSHHGAYRDLKQELHSMPKMTLIVDLSQDSDEDDCYVLPSRPPLRKSPLKRAVRTPAAPPLLQTTIRRNRPSSSSSSSIVSFLSPPPKVQVQARITTFFTPPGIKAEIPGPIRMPRMPLVLAPMTPRLSFTRPDLSVDDNEAPVPDEFDLPSDYNRGTADSPMEIDSSDCGSVVLLSSSPPVSPVRVPYASEKRPGALKRGYPLALEDMPSSLSSRPLKVTRRTPESNDAGPGSVGNPVRKHVGVSKRFAPDNMPVANHTTGVSTLTYPAQQVETRHPLDSTEESKDIEIDQAAAQPRLICKLHSDPDCFEMDCVNDFFDEYCPYHDIVPDKNQPPNRGQQTTIITKPLSAAITTALPEEPNGKTYKQMQRDYLGCVVASDTLGPEVRRPYMPLLSRRFLKSMRAQQEMWDKIFKGYDGCLMHVGFTPKECQLLGCRVSIYLDENPSPNQDFPDQSKSGEVSEDLHIYLKAAFAGYTREELEHIYGHHVEYPMAQLPGRTKKDIVDFLLDATEAVPVALDPFFYVDFSAGGPPKPPTKGMRTLFSELGLRGVGLGEQTRARAAEAMKMFKPVWQFKEGSSDILDVQWSPTGRNFGMGSATFSDAYNRAGNLMLGTTDPFNVKMGNVKMLFRHAFKVRHQPVGNLERFKWATVTGVRFSNDGSHFYSAGYDGLVKTWNGKTGQWISDIPLHAKVMTMVTSPLKDHHIAAATNDGCVHVIRLDNDGKPVIIDQLHISKQNEYGQGQDFYASCLQFGNRLHPNWLIAGYDTNNDRQQYGAMAVFDIETQKILYGVAKHAVAKNKMFLHNTRHFDIAMHEEGNIFVTASLHRPHKKYSPGIYSGVRVFDIRDIYQPILLKSPQRDINRVTISPCQHYVTSSSTKGSTLVWDLRTPDKIMTELKHGESKLPLREDVDIEQQDTGVTFAQWGPYHDRFYTGSSDGIIKEWDITSGNPFIQDIAKVDTQIMSAAFSPSWDELIVGECSGTATLFSTRGDEGVAPAHIPVDWTEDPDMVSPEAGMPMVDWTQSDANSQMTVVEEEEEESGVQIARQLVAEGKMHIVAGRAYAVGDSSGDNDNSDGDYDDSEMLI